MKKIFGLSAILILSLLSGCVERKGKITVTGKLERKDDLKNGCMLHINSGNIQIDVRSTSEEDCRFKVGENLTLTWPFSQ